LPVSAGASWSNLQDPFEAGQEAATLAQNQLAEDTSDLALVFSSPQYSTPELLEGVRAVTGRTPVIGCSDAGNLSPEGPAHDSVAVMLIRAEGLEIRPGAGDKLSQDPEAAGRAMAQQALEGRLGSGSGPGSLLLTFAEGARGNLSAVLRGARQVVGEGFPIVGAASADNGLFTETTQYVLSYLMKDSVAGFLLGGPISFGIGTRHGWVPISRPRAVTRSRGEVVCEIDGLPALSLYRDYLGEAADDLDNDNLARTVCVYPLGFDAEGENEPLVRFPQRMTAEGHLVFGGEVAEGTQVRLMLGSKNGVVESARLAAQDALAALGDKPARAGIVFSCFAREYVLGREAPLEMRAIREVLGERVPLIGLYSYGEMAPARRNGGAQSRYRNDSVVVLTIGDG
jgi:hypothetical protein